MAPAGDPTVIVLAGIVGGLVWSGRRRRPAGSRLHELPPRADRDPRGHVTVRPRVYDWQRETS